VDIKRRLLLGVAAIALAGLATAQESRPEQIVVPLTRPDEAGRLIVERHQGSISVRGYEGNVVLIKALLRRSTGSAPSDPAAEGLKPVSAAAIQLDAQEVDNVVTVNAHSRNKSIDLDISVPVRFVLKLGVLDDGDVFVGGLTGDVEVDNPYGRVRLERLTGSANVNTVDGDITARFLGVAAGVPLAFSSVHGKIDVSFPADADLTVRVKSDEAMVYSDFDIAVEKRKSRTDPAGKTGGTRIALEEWTTGRIGRGGTDVLLKSFDGNIYIRKTQETPSGA
jgi:hypothetical protein